MTSFETQIQRVNRHFESCCEKYDEISLLDLTHALRVIGESKDQLEAFLLNRGENKLRHVRPTKKVSRLLNNKPFVMALLPSMLEMKGISVGEIIVVHDFIGAEHANTLNPPRWPSKFLSISNWYGAEALISRGRADGPKLSISRDRIVKRVANYLGPSHPANSDRGHSSIDDSAIAEFMKIEIAERPLPYYVVMSVAQEILRAAGLQKAKS